MKYKDSQNKVHDDDEGRALSLPSWPKDLTPITDEEAAVLLAPPPPTLAKARADQTEILISSCGAAIVAGFKSSALGTEHTYPSTPIDQSNLIGSVASGLPTVDFWCADVNGVWNLRSHTAAQIKQVLADGATQRIAYSVKLKGLVDQVNDPLTDTIEKIEAVVW